MAFCCEEKQTNQETRKPGKEIQGSDTFLRSWLPYSSFLGFLASRFLPLLMSDQLPNSRKIFVSGKLHLDLRVPFREISLAPTKTISGEIEINEPVRVYDTSGPWGDSDFRGNVEQGLPPLRAKWIRNRGDVEEIEGRKVTPIDDGFLSEKHAASAAERKRRTPNKRQ